MQRLTIMVSKSYLCTCVRVNSMCSKLEQIFKHIGVTAWTHAWSATAFKFQKNKKIIKRCKYLVFKKENVKIWQDDRPHTIGTLSRGSRFGRWLARIINHTRFCIGNRQLLCSHTDFAAGIVCNSNYSTRKFRRPTCVLSPSI